MNKKPHNDVPVESNNNTNKQKQHYIIMLKRQADQGPIQLTARTNSHNEQATGSAMFQTGLTEGGVCCGSI